METLTLGEIAQITNGKLIGNPLYEVSEITIDSRKQIQAKGTLFIALKGPRYDGHQFISEMIKEKGILSFISETIPEEDLLISQLNFIIVPDTFMAFHMLAKAYREKFNCNIIGITGSNGKTIVKEWLNHLLSSNYRVTRSPKSYNSQTGVPLSVLLLDHSTQVGIFEAGISMKNEMEKIAPMINPRIGIITNILEAHQENFQSKQEKCDEKIQLFKNSQKLIFRSDYPEIEISLLKFNYKCIPVTWSTSYEKKPDLLIISEAIEDQNTRIQAIFRGKKIETFIPYSDKASIENAIHCWLICLELGMDNELVNERMLTLPSIEMRMQLKRAINNCVVVSDCYNSDLQSLSIAIDFLNQQPFQNKTLVVSDIYQTGKQGNELYNELAKLLNNKNISRIIGVGKEIGKYKDLFPVNTRFYQTTDELISNLELIQFQNEAILFKGSRAFQLEKAVNQLEEKNHRTVMEINLNAMVNNLNYFRSLLPSSTKLMAMVKAFSYGSGTYEIANLLAYNKIDYLAVAFTDEGVHLRKSGIKTPILVMNPEEQSFRQMVEFQLEPEIYSFRVLNLFLNELMMLNVSNYPVHIKLETGMQRLGFAKNDIHQLCIQLKNNPFLRINSVFSHFVASDEPQHDSFTLYQYDLFIEMANQLENSIKYQFYKHIQNSAGIERFSNLKTDIARVGIGLYGISVLPETRLDVVSTLKSYISQIKWVKSGESIGYGRKGVAESDTRIGIIPIGYADGYSRIHSNGNGYMYINGKRAPTVGNICMDMCMINLNDIDAKEGDPVEIFGNNISVNELANQRSTIPYEIFTSVSPRVKRVYYHE